MRRKALAVIALALVITGVAFATTAQASKGKSKAAPKVTYILKGTLSNFTAASTTASGSVTISVTHSNYHAHALVGQQLTFAISMTTPTNLTGGTITNGAHGIVKFRAPLRVANTTLMAALTATTPMTASQVISR
jgi:flagellar basal body-associated protein FliL